MMNVSVKVQLDNWYKSALHLLYPHQCLGCNIDQMSASDPICPTCLLELPRTHFERFSENPIEKIFHGRIPVEAATSLFYFSKGHLLQQLMHALKYQGNKYIGYYLGKELGKSIQSNNRFNRIDALIPMPMVQIKADKRGYNQAHIIADGIASVLDLPVIEQAVVRKGSTKSQTGLNRMLRWQNVQERFELLNGALLKNRNVLIIDDVVTTGASIESYSLEILKANPASLSIATVACAEQ
jgi:ComF family protein